LAESLDSVDDHHSKTHLSEMSKHGDMLLKNGFTLLLQREQ
jgi:hypothetical protein